MTKKEEQGKGDKAKRDGNGLILSNTKGIKVYDLKAKRFSLCGLSGLRVYTFPPEFG